MSKVYQKLMLVIFKFSGFINWTNYSRPLSMLGIVGLLFGIWTFNLPDGLVNNTIKIPTVWSVIFSAISLFFLLYSVYDYFKQKSGSTTYYNKENKSLLSNLKSYNSYSKTDNNLALIFQTDTKFQVSRLEDCIFWWNKKNDLNIKTTTNFDPRKQFVDESWKRVIYNKITKTEGKALFNEHKIRLCNLDYNNKIIELSQTCYFHSIITNESLADTLIRAERPSSGTIEEYYTKQIFESENIPQSFEKTLMSNHVGVNVLLFHPNCGFVIQRQSRANMQNPGMLVATGSGSCDWFKHGFLKSAKVKNNISFRNLIIDEGIRELREETRTAIDINTKSKCHIMGMSRDFSRAGKPDFLIFCLLDSDSNPPENEKILNERLKKSKEIVFVDELFSDVLINILNTESPELKDYLNSDKNTILELILQNFCAERIVSLLEKNIIDNVNEINLISLINLEINKAKSDGAVEYTYENWKSILQVFHHSTKCAMSLRMTCALILKRLEDDHSFNEEFVRCIQKNNPNGNYGSTLKPILNADSR
jgi:hypothetical protein